MGQYLIDNNVISSYFSGRFFERAMDFLAGVLDNKPNISVITQIEALSWKNPEKFKEAFVASFVGEAFIVPLTENIVTQCIHLRRRMRIKIPDAIIAATAMVYDFTRLTSDRSFTGIERLRIKDPMTV